MVSDQGTRSLRSCLLPLTCTVTLLVFQSLFLDAWRCPSIVSLPGLRMLPVYQPPNSSARSALIPPVIR